MRAAAVVTTQTTDQAARVRAAFPGLVAPVVTIPHGIDLPARSAAGFRAALGIGPAAPLVVQIAGVRCEKGFPGVLDLVDRMRAALPALRFVSAGPMIDPSLLGTVDAWFSARPWAAHLGAIARERALDAMAAATCTLHASTVEGFSNALLESMALGTPVIARDIPASRAAVTDGVDGLLFRTDDEAVAHARHLVSDPALHARIAAAARATVTSRFSPAAEIDAYVDAYVDATQRGLAN